MSPTIGVLRFPGTNCEFDVMHALEGLGASARLIWHGDATLGDVDGVVIPGGFAHGDYLRPGAIARFSPAMIAVERFSADGGPVVGICNGFQVLTEAGLLPGALQKNAGLRFICGPAELEVVSARSVLSSDCAIGERLSVPINHFEGNYTCSPQVLEELRSNDQIVLCYVDNPNGSVGDIAGISNRAGNVVGLMPHPERACDILLGSDDGRKLLGSFVGSALAAG